MRSIPAIVVCALLCLVVDAAAEPVKVWKGGEGRGVRAEHLTMPLTEEAFYSDRYTAEAWFDDGSRVWVSILVKNFGLSKGTMTVKSRWIDADGKTHYTKSQVARGKYTVTAAPFSVSAAGPRHPGSSLCPAGR